MMLWAERSDVTKVWDSENHQGRETRTGEHFCTQHNPQERVGTTISCISYIG